MGGEAYDVVITPSVLLLIALCLPEARGTLK